MNNKKAFIFVGRAGCGKGTQLELLKNYLMEQGSGISCKTFIMGDLYREFFKKEGYFPDTARDITMIEGRLQPDFLTNSLLVNKAIETIDEDSILFFDGYPRTISQMNVTESLLRYTKRDDVIVINIEVSRDSVIERMLSRARADDKEEAIKMRLNEYDNNVVPMIEEIKKNSFFKYIEIDGEPTIEEIHKDIISKLYE